MNELIINTFWAFVALGIFTITGIIRNWYNKKEKK